MAGDTRGPVGAGGTAKSVKDGKTSSLVLAPTPSSLGALYTMDDSLSYELSDAPLVCVPTTVHPISLAEMRVVAWLREYRVEIIEAEAKFSVDRRAIAGAIAWEALKNDKAATNFAHNYLGSGRSVGPGKVHIRLGVLWGGVDNTWSYQVEKQRIVKTQSYEDRIKLLATPSGAITYIGAAMDLIATTYERAGSPGICSPDMRVNPYILTNEYQGTDPEKWAARVKTIKAGETLKAGNSMALWLSVPRNMGLIEDGVGNAPTTLAPACKDRDLSAAEGNLILKSAQEYLNVPYSYGGGTKSGIDCSHLIYKAISAAFPKSGYEYLSTSLIPSSPQLRKLEKSEQLQAGDIILFNGHVGFYDPAPPADMAGQTLFSARGDQQRSAPGVTWGKSEWFGAVIGNYRLRLPCD